MAVWEATKLLPYPMVFRRYYALFEALTERAVWDMHLCHVLRMRPMNAGITAKETMRKRAPSGTRGRQARPLHDNCTRLGKMGCRPEISMLIRDRTRPVNLRAAVVHPGSWTMQ